MDLAAFVAGAIFISVFVALAAAVAMKLVR
jgi:hypothetical protein